VLGIPLENNITASEPHSQSQEFIVTNLHDDVKHLVANLAAQSSDSSYCVKHGRNCLTSKGAGRPVDVLIGGTPCQPFTAMRRNNCRKHDLYNVTFGDSDMREPHNSLMHLLEVTLPGALILEQVAGFGNFDTSLQERPATYLIDKLLGLKGPGGEPHFVAVRCFEINSSTWIQLERPRFLLCPCRCKSWFVI
jgi:hypothetical protein